MAAVHRSSRSAAALLTVLLLACGALLAPAGALAAESLEPNSFNELSEKASQETTPTETTSTTKTEETESKNSSKTILIAAGAAVVLLAAIGFVIVRDARRVAPAGAPDDFVEGKRGHDPAARRRNRRAKAKAARQQRKKNR